MRPRWLVVLLALAALVAPTPAAPGSAGARQREGQQPVNARTPRADELDFARRLIDEALEVDGASPRSVADRLAELGADGLPLAWALLWQPSVGESSPLVERGIPTRQVLRELALTVPRSKVAAFLRALEERGADAAMRAWALGLLTEIGTGRELQLLLDLGAPAPVGEERGRAPLPGMRPALASVLRRDAQAFRSLRGEAARLGPDAAREVLLALVEVGDARALDAIGDLLDSAAADELEVLAALASVGRDLPPPFDPYLLRKLRQRADDGDPTRCASAVRALEALADEDSIPRLLELLESRDAVVRGAAHGALRTLTGLGFSSDPRRWRCWYTDEQLWWEEDSARAFEELQSPEESRVMAALAEVVTRRLHRGLLAREVAGLLQHDSAPLRRLACSSLAQLASAAPAYDLVQRLDDVDPGVARAAHQALVQILDQPLFPDPEPWLLYLEGRRSDLR